MVERTIKNLNLRSMQIDAHQAVRAGCSCTISNQTSRNRLTSPSQPILAGIRGLKTETSKSGGRRHAWSASIVMIYSDIIIRWASGLNQRNMLNSLSLFGFHVAEPSAQIHLLWFKAAVYSTQSWISQPDLLHCLLHLAKPQAWITCRTRCGYSLRGSAACADSVPSRF